jgi:pre-rRNA-processing protein TSR1
MPANKSHKQKFASKHAIAERQQGRAVTHPVGPKASLPSQSKDRMRQAAEALRKKKNDAVVHQRRIGTVGPPKIVGVVPLNETANPLHVANELERVATGEYSSGLSFPRTIVAKSLKQRLTLVVENDGSEQRISDVAKVADILMLVVDCSQGVQEAIRDLNTAGDVDCDDDDDDGGASHVSGTTWFNDVGLCVTDTTRELISILNAQGLPTVTVVLQGLESFANQKKKLKTIKVHRRYFQSVFGDDVKIFAHESDSDIQTLLRTLSVLHLRKLKWREFRPYLVVEEVLHSGDSIEVRGYLHGNNLSANQLLHITDHGTFQMDSITDCGDPHPLTRSAGAASGSIEQSDEASRESLTCIQPSETVEDEGLPTEADVAFEQQKVKKIRVPAGVSEYQAAWYEFEDGNEVIEDPSTDAKVAQNDDDFMDMDAMSYRTTQTDLDFLKAADVVRHERMTDEERMEEMTRLKDMSEEEVWNPDMVDTPVNLPARQRFSKYRGMKSFQTGVWDVNENLPIQYGHIFKLQGYNRVRDAAIEKSAAGLGKEGMYLSIKLLDVPQTVMDNIKDAPLLMCSGQLEHEQKWSVLHFHVQRNSELEGAIKSKTPVLAHIGFRKFYVSPVFSDPTVGDRAKFARFFHEGEKFRVASFYGPISFLPCPILMFLVPSLEEQAETNALRLACFGGALPPNPDLLILKRAVLTGRVAMINKKHSVIKYMFFNEDDVNWFKPVDLYTKLGRRGKILKAVGTHGLFKVALNDQIMQHDVICMDLFKRVFPKWTTVPFNAAELAAQPSQTDNEE